MKFKYNPKKGAYYFEMARAQKVEEIVLDIDGKIYPVNTDVIIENGSYTTNVIVKYEDGTSDVIKNQPLCIDGSDKKVTLDMKSVRYRVINLLINIKFYAVLLFVSILAVTFDFPMIIVAMAVGGCVSQPNDTMYRLRGFDKTFRAVIK